MYNIKLLNINKNKCKYNYIKYIMYNVLYIVYIIYKYYIIF